MIREGIKNIHENKVEQAGAELGKHMSFSEREKIQRKQVGKSRKKKEELGPNKTLHGILRREL